MVLNLFGLIAIVEMWIHDGPISGRHSHSRVLGRERWANGNWRCCSYGWLLLDPTPNEL